MDRRVIGLIVFGAALAIVVIAILIGRSSDSDEGDSEPPPTSGPSRR